MIYKFYKHLHSFILYIQIFIENNYHYPSTCFPFCLDSPFISAILIFTKLLLVFCKYLICCDRSTYTTDFHNCYQYRYEIDLFCIILNLVRCNEYCYCVLWGSRRTTQFLLYYLTFDKIACNKSFPRTCWKYCDCTILNALIQHLVG